MCLCMLNILVLLKKSVDLGILEVIVGKLDFPKLYFNN